MKRRIALALIIGMILILCCSCDDPPIGSRSIDDPAEYMNVNDFSNEMLQTYFVGVFPNKDILTLSDCVYEYRYSCAFLGDPNVLIYLKTNSFTEKLLGEEQTRIQALSLETYYLEDGRVLYSMNSHFEKSAIKYMDDETLDGDQSIFELVLVDSSNRVIEYLFAFQQDNNVKSDTITRFLDAAMESIPVKEFKQGMEIEWDQIEFPITDLTDIMVPDIQSISTKQKAIEVGNAILEKCQQQGCASEKVLQGVFHSIQDDIWLFSYGEDVPDKSPNSIVVYDMFYVVVDGDSGELLKAWVVEG